MSGQISTQPSVATDVTHDMTGRVCLVTGSNTGIGRVTALELARAGAHVFMACRSADRTQPVVDAIKAATGNDNVEFVPLDLASLDSVRACAQAFLARDLPLHALVANAGLAGVGGLTSDGFEMTVGVNHVGHFLLIQLLLDALKASAPSRIVIVASHAHRKTRAIDLDHVREPMGGPVGFRHYCMSKGMNIMVARELGRRLAGTDVKACSLHPGVIASDIWRRVPQPIRWLMTLHMVSNEQGARTNLHCTTMPHEQLESGRYYDDCKAVAPHPPADDDAKALELWDRSMEWVGLG